MPKITYLFGAGASAQSLPTIKVLPERINYIKGYIDLNYNYSEDETLTVRDFTFKAMDAKNYLLEGFDKLYNASQNHSTVDTYAKKLYVTSRHQEIEELVFFLALYFNIDQKLVGNDARYNTFLISILDSSAYDFPPNLKFLTWNYDLQFEIAYHNLLENSSPNLDYSLFNTRERLLEKDKFTSTKINGSCNITDSYDRSLYHLTNNITQKDPSPLDLKFTLEYAFTQIKSRKRYYEARVNIDFAWFKDSSFVNKISNLHEDTTVLVVIGYSFPFFNREVDRKIIRSMKNLKTIYIQDLYPENIVSRFLSILPDWKSRNIEIIPINTVDEFFLPPEL